MAKQKKPFYKRWWFITLVIIIVIAAIGGGGEDKSEIKEDLSATVTDDLTKEDANMPQTDETEANINVPAEKEVTKIKAGNYKIGTDLPAGEYKIFADGAIGYYEVCKDSSGEFDSIITNDNFTTFTYLTVSEGQYLKLQMSYAIPIDEAPAYESDEGYGPGQYKVGYDIPAGEYNVRKEEGQLYGYVEISKDSKGTIESIISNDNFETNKYVTVKDGQYLKIMFGYIE